MRKSLLNLLRAQHNARLVAKYEMDIADYKKEIEKLNSDLNESEHHIEYLKEEIFHTEADRHSMFASLAALKNREGKETR